MPISTQHQCLFVHIPKTAGTSIEKALNMFYSWKIENRDSLFGLIQSPDLKERNFLTHYLQHLTTSEIHQIQPNVEQLFTFSFIRNPWDRMVSIYSNIDPHLLIQADNKGIELRDLSFHEFLLKTAVIEHAHLQEQHKFIINQEGNLMVDFLGQFESVEADFKKLCLELNIKLKLQLPRDNQSIHKNYKSYYTDETREIVAHRYKMDIEMFNYTF